MINFFNRANTQSQNTNANILSNPPQSESININKKYLTLSNDMRSVWEQHVWWTRNVMLNIVYNLPNTAETVDQLMINPEMLANIFSYFYSGEIASQIQTLFTDHLNIGGELVLAAKAKDTAKIMQLQADWRKNADEIAAFLAKINPYYNEETLRKMLYLHIDMLMQEATELLAGKGAEQIFTMDKIENHALMMADYLTEGIARQFSKNFA